MISFPLMIKSNITPYMVMPHNAQQKLGYVRQREE